MDYIVGLKRFENDEKLRKRISFLIPELQRAFPDVNLKNEFAAAHAWLTINAQYKKDYARFLLNWVKRVQNRMNELKALNRVSIPLKKFVEVKPPEEDVMTAEDWANLKRGLYEPKTKDS